MGLPKSFEKNLYNRIGVFKGFLQKEQVEECLEAERASAGRLDLGQLLLEKGYLTPEQLEVIQEIRRKKSRKMLRDTKDLERSERAFGQIALRRELIGRKDLEEALLEQERLHKLNLQFRLGEILVAQGVLEVEQVLDILAEQKKRILLCPSCDFHYTVFDDRLGNQHRCRKCGDLLTEPLFLDAVAVDGVIEAAAGAAPRVDGPSLIEERR
jgi:hypothetical protein